MKRVFLAMGVALVASAVLSAGAGAATVTAKRVCTTGRVRCTAMVAVAPSGKVLSAVRPAALPSGLTPAQLHKAYNLPTKTAVPATVAVVDAFDYSSAYSDLTRYSTTFGLPVLPQCSQTVTASCFQKVNLGAATNSAVKRHRDVEIALDIEAIHAVCQNCKIVLVEAKSLGLGTFAAAERRANQLAGIVSNSWGIGVDGGLGSPVDSAFNYPGHAILASSGDDGYAPSYPAILNTVISVGGTTLHLKSDGSYESERTWSGTGSGCATGKVDGVRTVAPLSFQRQAPGFSTAGCPAGIRGDNDIAAVADPSTGMAVYANGVKWIRAGGTSLSAPLVAAMYALGGEVGSVKRPSQFLYAHLGTSAFRDVTAGSNEPWTGCDGVPARCTARPGYDLPTGVGTPNGLAGFRG